MAPTSTLHRKLAEAVSAGVAGGGRIAVPEPCRLLWGWFSDLNGTRTWHQAGPNPIGYAEIEAYARLTGQPLRPQDVRAIRQLDEAWIAAVHQRREAGDGRPPGVAVQNVSPAAFDAVFG